MELISDNMLQEIITDTNLVWDKSSFKTTFLVDISNESINELLDNRNKLANLGRHARFGSNKFGPN